MPKYLLALDAGTTSSRAIVFSLEGKIISMSQAEFPQIFPKEGYVEHNPDDILGLLLSFVAERLPKRYDVDPLDDIQVISCTRKGPLGTKELNSVFQEALNPKSHRKSEKKYGNVREKILGAMQRKEINGY